VSTDAGAVLSTTTLPTGLPCTVETDKIIAGWQQQYEEATRKHEAYIAAVVNKYEKSLTGIQAALDRLATQRAESSAQIPVPPPPKPEQAPSAIWINAPDGEKLMVINQAAAVMFLAIFGRMQEVTEELKKMVSPTKK
jgi:hypothetical protein